MSFREENLRNKLRDLTPSQASIQTIAPWVIHHRRASDKIAQVWLEALTKESNAEKNYAFLCLVNDVLQRSKRHGEEFVNSFSPVLKDGLVHINEKCRNTEFYPKIERTINILAERMIIGERCIKEIRLALGLIKAEGAKQESQREEEKQTINKQPEKQSEQVDPTKLFLDFNIAHALSSELIKVENDMGRNKVLFSKVQDHNENIYQKNFFKEIKENEVAKFWQEKIDDAKMDVEEFINKLSVQVGDLSAMLKLINNLKTSCEESLKNSKLLIPEQGLKLDAIKENITILAEKSGESQKREASEVDQNITPPKRQHIDEEHSDQSAISDSHPTEKESSEIPKEASLSTVSETSDTEPVKTTEIQKQRPKLPVPKEPIENPDDDYEP